MNARPAFDTATVVLNPQGIIVPSFVGQMFFDISTEVFYQSRGPTENDWHLVTPAELSGSFVKVYDLFLSVPSLDPQGSEAREKLHAAELVRQTMDMDGVKVLQAFCWRTAGGANAAMTRLQIGAVDGLRLFFGFDADATPVAVSDGLGFVLEDGGLRFERDEVARVKSGDTVLLRVETTMQKATAYLNDQPIADCAMNGPVRAHAVVTLFAKSPGARLVAPGYEHILQKALGKKP